MLQLHETGQLPAVPLFHQAAKCAQLFEMPGAGGLFSVKGDGDRDFGFGFNLIVYYVGPGDAFPQLVWYNQVLAAHCIPLLSASRCSVHPCLHLVAPCRTLSAVAPSRGSRQAGPAGAAAAGATGGAGAATAGAATAMAVIEAIGIRRVLDDMPVFGMVRRLGLYIKATWLSRRRRRQPKY